MKVGTDGTLLGCWADANDANQILDIGAGTGVIGIMCAQKNQESQITSLEIDSGALIDARFNIDSLNESWRDRITLVEGRLQDFAPETIYDLIVSNPPYFENSQENTDEARKNARHTSSLHYSDIFEFSAKYLSEKGRLSMILPISNGQDAMKVCEEYGLFVQEYCEVKPVPQKNPHRLLLTLGRVNTTVKSSLLTIETGVKRHEYTKEYIRLGKDFYLYF